MSIMSRITQSAATTLMVGDLESSFTNLTKLQQEVATGKQLNQPSDNPTGTAEVLTMSAQIGRYTQYGSNARDGAAWLGTADSALQSVNTALDRVQTDVLSGANGSAMDPQSLQALSQDVLTIKQSLIGLSGTTYNQRPIFSGTYGMSPYPSATTAGVSDPTSPNYNPAVAYQYSGSTTAVSRNIAPGQSLDVSVTGDKVFGTGSTSVFAVLDQISQDLAKGNSSALNGADLASLKSAMNIVQQAQGSVGSLNQAINSAKTRAENQVASLQSQVSSITDADEAKAASELNLAEVAYQAALQTTAKVIQPSLAQFIQ